MDSGWSQTCGEALPGRGTRDEREAGHGHELTECCRCVRSPHHAPVCGGEQTRAGWGSICYVVYDRVDFDCNRAARRLVRQWTTAATRGVGITYIHRRQTGVS